MEARTASSPIWALALLLSAFGLILPGCGGSGAGAPFQLMLESDGAIVAAYDLNNLAVRPDADWSAVLRTAGGIPIYARAGEGGFVYLRRHDPPWEAKLDVLQLAPAEALAILAALHTREERERLYPEWHRPPGY